MLTETQVVPNSSLEGAQEIRSACAESGLRCGWAAMCSMFFLFFVSYIMRSQISDWEALAQPGNHWRTATSCLSIVAF